MVWAGLCRKDALGTRRLESRLGRKRVHVVPDASSDTVLASLRTVRPDLIVSWFWTKRLPVGVLALAPAIGVHPSLLPRHRGPDPTFWAIDSGDAATGVTAHRLAQEYDTGDILAQRSLPIDPTWTGWKLARALDRPSLQLLREVVDAYAHGHPPTAVPQDGVNASAAPQPTEDELSIRWSWDAERIARRVRAAAPWPGAWTEIGDRIVTLVRVRPTLDFVRALVPGESAVRGDGIAVVRSADSAVELLEGRDEDDQPLAHDGLADLVRSTARRSSAHP